jgi:hypothetical protein
MVPIVLSNACQGNAVWAAALRCICIGRCELVEIEWCILTTSRTASYAYTLTHTSDHGNGRICLYHIFLLLYASFAVILFIRPLPAS